MTHDECLPANVSSAGRVDRRLLKLLKELTCYAEEEDKDKLVKKIFQRRVHFWKKQLSWLQLLTRGFAILKQNHEHERWIEWIVCISVV